MHKKGFYLLGILLTILLGTLLNWWLCCNNESYNKEKEAEKIIVAEPTVNKTSYNPFSIKDGDFILNSSDNFNFKGSDFKIIEPISEELKNAISRLKEYSDKNSSKRITIIGRYSSGENNNSAYPNLGLARANAIKNYFVSQDISSKIIHTESVQKDSNISDKNNVFFGPVGFKITTSEESTAADALLVETCKSLKENPLILYFNTGATQINLTVEQRKKFADISRCIDKLGVKVQVVGYTDNTGNAANNIILGQKRADFIKNYLIQNGILSMHIEASSKGPQEPIADNATEAGRAKNRRTVVTIN